MQNSSNGRSMPSETPGRPRFMQPAMVDRPTFQQPGEVPPPVQSAKRSMTQEASQTATRLRETFYAYSNRLPRNQQRTLGPSEAGTPCDRRLAMSLLGVEPVNPGGDGWAAFVGTCVHDGLAEMFKWANAGSGRYQVEMPLTLPCAVVPKGTGDLLDRVLCMFLDHKLMGNYSLRKLRSEGPSETYRKQVQIYGLGASLMGERVKDVAIVGWPREGSTLDDLFEWQTPFNRAEAEEALARVERIADTATRLSQDQPPMVVAKEFPVADPYECRFCPFHLKGDRDMQRGCPGK